MTQTVSLLCNIKEIFEKYYSTLDNNIFMLLLRLLNKILIQSINRLKLSNTATVSSTFPFVRGVFIKQTMITFVLLPYFVLLPTRIITREVWSNAQAHFIRALLAYL